MHYVLCSSLAFPFANKFLVNLTSFLSFFFFLFPRQHINTLINVFIKQLPKSDFLKRWILQFARKFLERSQETQLIIIIYLFLFCIIATARRTESLIAIVIIMSNKFKHAYAMYLNLHKLFIKRNGKSEYHISFSQSKPCPILLQQGLCK